MIVHFGGASRKGFMNAKDFKNAKGLKTDIEIIKKWFVDKKIELINLITTLNFQLLFINLKKRVS